MKIALCFSGQPRSVEAAYPFIKENILEPNNPDVFIHSWIDDSILGKRPIAAGGEVASEPIPHNIKEIILDLYKPGDNFHFEKQRDFDEKNYNHRKAQFIRPKHSLSQRYSVKQSIEMAYFSFTTYDVIIRMRFDWAIKTKIIVDQLDLSGIIVPNDCPHIGGINDQFAVGHATSMLTYGRLSNNIDVLYNEHKLPFVDEILLGHHLKLHNIPVTPTPIEYKILRYNGDPHIKYTEEYIT